MKQQQATGEDEQRPIAQQFGHLGVRLIGASAGHGAVGVFRIDLARRDGAQCQQRRPKQQHGDDEHRARGQEIAAGAHHRRRQAIADRGETGVAAEPRADRGVADQAEADRGHGRAQYAACQRVQDRPGQHDREDRQRRIGQGGDADGDDGDAGNEAFGARGIDDGAARHLAQQRHDARRRLHKADIELRPALPGEVDRHERAETGLHVGDEEDEPIEPAQAARRRMQRWLAAFGCRLRRRQGFAVARVLQVPPVVNGG